MNQDVLQPILLDCENDFLERDAAARLQALVLARVPPEWLHTSILARRVPFVISASQAHSRLTYSEFPKCRLYGIVQSVSLYIVAL